MAAVSNVYPMPQGSSPHRDVASSSPTLPTSGVPSIALSTQPFQSVLPVAKYVDALAIQLTLHGMRAFPLPAPDNDRRRWFRRRVKQIQSATVYIPLIDVNWIYHDEGVFELYHALRSYILHGNPIVVPLFDATLVEASESDTSKIRRSLSPSQQDLLWMMKDTCASLSTASTVKMCAIQVNNLLVQLGVGVSKHSIATGASLVDIYRRAFAAISPHHPNSGLIRSLEEIAQPQGITHLNLRHLFIADAGTAALADVITALPHLQSIDLGGNGVSNKGLHAICDALSVHPSIAHLDLSDNDISQAGVSDLFFLLGENTRIVAVKLDQNPIYSDVWLKRIEGLLTANRALREEQTAQRLLAVQNEAIGNDQDGALGGSVLGGSQRGGSAAAQAASSSSPLAWLDAPTVTWKVVAVRSELGDISVHIQTTQTPKADPAAAAASPNGGGGLVGAGSTIGLPQILSIFVVSEVELNAQNSLAAARRNADGRLVRPIVISGAKNLTSEHRAFLSSCRAMLDRDVSLSSFSVQRLNDKKLQYILEGGFGKMTEVAQQAMSLALRAAGLALSTPHLHKVSLRLDNHAVPSSSSAQTPAPRAPLAHGGEDDEEDEVPSHSFFIERELLLFGVGHDTRVVGKTMPQLFHRDVGQYAGNIREEVNALLDLIAVQEDSVDAAADAEGGSKANEARLAAAQKNDQRTEDRYNAAVSSNVVHQWGGALNKK